MDQQLVLQGGLIPGIGQGVAALPRGENVPAVTVPLEGALGEPAHHLRAMVLDAVWWQAVAALEGHQNRACRARASVKNRQGIFNNKWEKIKEKKLWNQQSDNECIIYLTDRQ